MALIKLNNEEIPYTDILTAAKNLKLAVGNRENNGHWSKKVIKEVDIGTPEQREVTLITNISIRYELGNISVGG